MSSANNYFQNVHMLRLIFVIVGAIAGGIFGSGIGIAGGGGAIAGTVPLAIIGGYVGWRLARVIRPN